MNYKYIKYIIAAGVFFALFWNYLADPDKLWTHGLGIVLCGVLMGWVALVWHRECLKNKDSAKLESYAEQMYMLGYLLTLSAIGGSLLRLFSPAMAGTSLDTALSSATLFSIGGVKLVTTIFGLVIMFIFKEEAAQWSAYDDTVEKYLERIRSASETMVTHAVNISEQVRNMAEAFSPELVEEMGRNMKLLTNSLDAGRVAADDFSKQTHACTTSQIELRQALDNLKTTAGELDVALKHLEVESLGAVKTGLEAMGSKLEQLKNLLPQAWFDDLKKLFEQLLEACRSSLLIWKDFEAKTSTLATKSLVNLQDKMDAAAKSTGVLGSSMETLTADHFPAFTTQFRLITEGAANTRKHVLASVAAINKSAKTLRALDRILGKLKPNSADASELEKIEEGASKLSVNLKAGLEALNGVTNSLQALNAELGIPSTASDFGKTVGRTDVASGGVNGRLRSFAEGLDAIIARTGPSRLTTRTTRPPEKEKELGAPGLSRAFPPVTDRMPGTKSHVSDLVDHKPQPVTFEGPRIEPAPPEPPNTPNKSSQTYQPNYTETVAFPPPSKAKDKWYHFFRKRTSR